jgi:hypothetical protein
MTAKDSRKPALDDVLNEIAAAPNPPDAQTLRAWTAKFPDFAKEIIEFATDWVDMEIGPCNDVVADEEVDVVVNRTMSRVQVLLDCPQRPGKLTDLPADIDVAGHDFDSFQRAVGIDRSILDCLIARLVEPATVPTELVREISNALKRSIECVRDYLRLTPQPATAYKSRKRPTQKQAAFAEIVQHSSLSASQKARWLAEAPDPLLRE